jgi:polyphenol oxidase
MFSADDSGVLRDNGVFAVTAPQGFSVGVAHKPSNSVDYSLPFEDSRQDEKRLLASLTGVPERRIVFLNQVHGDAIVDIAPAPRDDARHAGDADALVTALPGVCLVIRTADCVPVFLADPVRRVLGAAHSGWKGTRLEIARKTLEFMARRYGSLPADIHASLLPSIGPGSYRVNRDVFDLFDRGRIVSGEGLYLDLWAHIESSLRDAGVPAENIRNPRICTMRHNDRFFSHRCGDSGRNLNFGFMSE